MSGEERRVQGSGDRGQAFKQVEGWGVEELIRDAEDAAVADGTEMLPVALCDDAVKRDTVSGAAPCEEKDVRVKGGDGLWRSVDAGSADETAVGGGDELSDPGLGMDERLAPFFAVDGLRWRVVGEGAGLGEGGLKRVDEDFGLG